MTQLLVINQTGRNLIATGFKGDDVTLNGPSPLVPAGGAFNVATFNAGGGRWDWVYLQDATTQQQFQIYIEQTRGGTHYTFFGYYNKSSSESDSNPSPFPSGYEDCLWSGGPIAYYTLMKSPPPQKS
ncbi:MAG TPA: hypothetical protein VF526_09510 [Solirubrobacteraceae bacterium]